MSGLGGFGVIVNNADIAPISPIDKITPASIEKLFSINVDFSWDVRKRVSGFELRYNERFDAEEYWRYARVVISESRD